MFSLFMCIDNAGGIGMRDGSIPFRNAEDLKNFEEKTIGGVVIMGRKTMNAIGRPFNGIVNVVISSRGGVYPAPIIMFKSIKECIIEMSTPRYEGMKKFIIGGTSLYEYFLANKLINCVYLTVVDRNYNCEIKVRPEFMKTLNPIKFAESNWRCQKKIVFAKDWTYYEFDIGNDEEEQFIQVLRNILNTGFLRQERTGVGCLSLFGQHLEFSLENNTLPICTTRRSPLNMIFEELMWFIRGETDARILQKKNIKIWNGNTTREFLDARGLTTYRDGDIGPTYGFNFRHYGAEYKGTDASYVGQGYDQLDEAIRLIEEEPFSRRIIINLWNPMTIDQCALPPCLFCYQFFVENGTLSCMMTQRSSDISLAGFWNITTGALLTHLIARVTRLTPKKLIWNIGDAHIYLNQLDAAKQQTQRAARVFPKLYFKDAAPASRCDITKFKYADLILIGYNPHPSIKNVMNI